MVPRRIFFWIFLKRLPVAGILAFLFFAGPFPSRAATVQVETLGTTTACPAGEVCSVRFRFRVSPAWYIHGPGSAEDGMIPTRLSFPDSPWIKVTDIRFPEPEKKAFPYASEPVAVLSGEFDVTARIVIARDAPLGQQEITGLLSYQACSAASCLPPESVSAPLSVTVGRPPETSDGEPRPPVWPEADGAASPLSPLPGRETGAGLWLTLVLIFMGGLALNLTPCVYPLIPITVSYFGGKARRPGSSTLLQGFIYICGLSVTNSVLGVTAGLSGAMVGAVLQNPLVLAGVAGVLAALACSFFGLWEMRFPSGLTRLASRNYRGYFGTFFMGLTLGIVAAPCLGPFILGLLTYVGQKADPFLGFLYFFVLSLGMGLPLAVLALFSGALERLPASGAWMTWIRKVLGWVLVAMAAYIIQPLVPDPKARWVLFAGIAAAAGLHLGWLDRPERAGRLFKTVKKGVGMVLILGGMALFFAGPPQHGGGVAWISYEKGMLSNAAQDKKPVILDFYADWCGPCKAMERDVFTDPEVMALMDEFLPVRVDLTRRHPHHEELLGRFQVRGVPTILFFDREGGEHRQLRIEAYEPADKVADRMRQAAGLAEK